MKGKTRKLVEGNKGVGKDDLGPKIINPKEKFGEFYCLGILFHQGTLLGTWKDKNERSYL